MLLAAASAIVALIFGQFAWRNVRRGWQFTRLGWQRIQTARTHGDPRTDIEARRAVSEGGYFLIAGLGWLLACLLAALLAALFLSWAIYYLRLGRV